ncbi:MAG: AEC family transporter [Candidatus Thorarchaeota archaeon]|nr:AEC family transporter [Candidatus Thorarchaeota archaeon]
MQSIVDVGLKLVLFYAFIAFGYSFGRLYHDSQRVNRAAGSLIVNVLIPVLIVQTFLTSPIGVAEDFLLIVVVTVTIHLLSVAMVSAVMLSDTNPPATRGAFLLAGTFPNGVFLPLPVTLMFIGGVGVPVIVVFSIVQMTILSTLGSTIGSLYGAEHVRWLQIVKKTLLFPPLLAVAFILPVLLIGARVPDALVPALSSVGSITTYLALFSVGLALCSGLGTLRVRSTAKVLVIRQVLVPLAVALLLIVLTPTPVTRMVLLIEAMMPPAVITVALSTSFGLDYEAAATAVILGTVVFLPLVPLIPLIIGV